MAVRLGIIGGTGIYKLPGATGIEDHVVETPYGKVNLKIGQIQSKKVAFLTRHGESHSIAPNQINYRANIWALQSVGVKELLATACSGSLNPEYAVGDFVLLNQFMEFTKNRPASFYDSNGDKPIAHVDVTRPYCKSLGNFMFEAAKNLQIKLKSGATYCCTEGPRYESAAEIQMFRILKGDLVGHTNYPEVVLAREAEICYCAVAIISNPAAGISESPLTSTEVKEAMEKSFAKIQLLLAETIALLPDDRDCSCHHALEHAFL